MGKVANEISKVGHLAFEWAGDTLMYNHNL